MIGEGGAVVQTCPLCQVGTLAEVVLEDGQQQIQCSQYPGCRFSASNWDEVGQALARFHHPIAPGHA